MSKLNRTEFDLLKQIDIHTGDNGGDFTFSDEISYKAAGIESEQSFGGYLSQLIKKGCVLGGDIQPNGVGPTYFQLFLTDKGRDILRAAGIVTYSY